MIYLVDEVGRIWWNGVFNVSLESCVKAGVNGFLCSAHVGICKNERKHGVKSHDVTRKMRGLQFIG